MSQVTLWKTAVTGLCWISPRWWRS